MGWLRLVGSLKWQVSFAEYRLFYRALLQKRPMILRSLLIVATLYDISTWHIHTTYSYETFICIAQEVHAPCTHECAIKHSCVRYNPLLCFECVTELWLMRKGAITCAQNTCFIRVRWCIDMHCTRHSCILHPAFNFVTWLVHARGEAHFYV